MEDKNNLDQNETEEIKEEKVEKKSNKRFILPAITVVLFVAVIFTLGIAFGQNWGNSGDKNGISDTASEEIVEGNSKTDDSEIEEVKADDYVIVTYQDKPPLSSDISAVYGDNSATVTLTYEHEVDIPNDIPREVINADTKEIVGEIVKISDRLYSGQIEVSGNPGETIRLQTDLDARPVSITFYDEITDADVDNLWETTASIRDISGKYMDSNGYVPTENVDAAINDVYETASKWLNEGKIKDCNKGYNGVYITTKAGLEIMYVPEQENILANGSDAPYIYSFKGLFPYATMGDIDPDTKKTINILNPNNNLNNIGNIINSHNDLNPNIETAMDDEVAFENIPKCFQPNSLVLWFGHGIYDEIHNSEYLVTGIVHPSDINLYTANSGVKFDTHDRVCINSKYFNTFLNGQTLENSVVFLMACHSAQDPSLPASFIKRGAKAVVGFDNVVDNGYAQKIFEKFISKLFEFTDDDKTSPSVEESLTYAQMDGYSYNENKIYKTEEIDGKKVNIISKIVTTRPKYYGYGDFRIKDMSFSKGIFIEYVDDIMDTTKDRPGYEYIYKYTLFKDNKEYTGEFSVYDTITFFQRKKADDLEFITNSYNSLYYELIDIDNDGDDEVILNLVNDFTTYEYGSLHIFNIKDGKLIEIPHEGLSGPTTEGGSLNMGITIIDNKIYYRDVYDDFTEYIYADLDISDKLVSMGGFESDYSDEFIQTLNNAYWD